MASLAALKVLEQLGLAKVVFQPKQHRTERSHSGNAGFTLIEMIVVVVIIGVLSAIAAPGWLAFTNRQRVSKVNDAVFSALQTAKSEAKRTKLSYSVCFKQESNETPKVAIYPTGSPPIACDSLTASQWKSLTENQSIQPNQIALIPLPPTTNPITFDYQGNLPPTQTPPLTVTVKVPNTETKRCVIVQTLLGGMRIDEGVYDSTTGKGCQ